MHDNEQMNNSDSKDATGTTFQNPLKYPLLLSKSNVNNSNNKARISPLKVGIPVIKTENGEQQQQQRSKSSTQLNIEHHYNTNSSHSQDHISHTNSSSSLHNHTATTPAHIQPISAQNHSNTAAQTSILNNIRLASTTPHQHQHHRHHQYQTKNHISQVDHAPPAHAQQQSNLYNNTGSATFQQRTAVAGTKVTSTSSTPKLIANGHMQQQHQQKTNGKKVENGKGTTGISTMTSGIARLIEKNKSKNKTAAAAAAAASTKDQVNVTGKNDRLVKPIHSRGPSTSSAVSMPENKNNNTNTTTSPQSPSGNSPHIFVNQTSLISEPMSPHLHVRSLTSSQQEIVITNKNNNGSKLVNGTTGVDYKDARTSNKQKQQQEESAQATTTRSRGGMAAVIEDQGSGNKHGVVSQKVRTINNDNSENLRNNFQHKLRVGHSSGGSGSDRDIILTDDNKMTKKNRFKKMANGIDEEQERVWLNGSTTPDALLLQKAHTHTALPHVSAKTNTPALVISGRLQAIEEAVHEINMNVRELTRKSVSTNPSFDSYPYSPTPPQSQTVATQTSHHSKFPSQSVPPLIEVIGKCADLRRDFDLLKSEIERSTQIQQIQLQSTVSDLLKTIVGFANDSRSKQEQIPAKPTESPQMNFLPPKTTQNPLFQTTQSQSITYNPLNLTPDYHHQQHPDHQISFSPPSPSFPPAPVITQNGQLPASSLPTIESTTNTTTATPSIQSSAQSSATSFPLNNLPTPPPPEFNLTVHNQLNQYRSLCNDVEANLIDVEASVETLRTNVVENKHRVTDAEVDALCQALATVTNEINNLKQEFTALRDIEISLDSNQAEFLEEQPHALEDQIRRAKHLSQTLFTLKKLASVQRARSKVQSEKKQDKVFQSRISPDRKSSGDSSTKLEKIQLFQKIEIPLAFDEQFQSFDTDGIQRKRSVTEMVENIQSGTPENNIYLPPELTHDESQLSIREQVLEEVREIEPDNQRRMISLEEAETTWERQKKQKISQLHLKTQLNKEVLPFPTPPPPQTQPPAPPPKPALPEKPVKLTNVLKIPTSSTTRLQPRGGNQHLPPPSFPVGNAPTNPTNQIISKRIPSLAYQSGSTTGKNVKFSSRNHQREIPNRHAKNPHLPITPNQNSIKKMPQPKKSGLKYPSSSGLTNRPSGLKAKTTGVAGGTPTSPEQLMKPPAAGSKPTTTSNVQNANDQKNGKSLQKKTFGFIRSSKYGSSKQSYKASNV